MAHVLGRLLERPPGGIMDRLYHRMVRCYPDLSQHRNQYLTYLSRSRMPFYSTIRLFLLAYLVLPQTQGAKIIYYNHIEPFLEDHEREIEAFIGDAHERLKALGLQYLTQLIDYVRVNVLGMAPREPDQAQAPIGAAGYAQSLLARFSLPNARLGGGTGAAGGATGADAFSLLSSAFAAAGILGGNSNTASATTSAPQSRTVQADQLSASGTLFPKTMDTATSAEKLTFLTSQRERLAVLMTALDKEQAQLSGLAYGHDYSREAKQQSTLESDIERRMHEIDATSGGLGSLRSVSSTSNPSSFLSNVSRTVSSNLNFPILSPQPSTGGAGDMTPTLSNLKRDRSENSFEEIAHEDVRAAESTGYEKGGSGFGAGPEVRGRAKRNSSGGWGAGWFGAASPGET